MRQIGSVTSEQEARRFEDYALTQGIKTRVEPETDGWAVWVYDEDHVPQGREELAQFQQNPDDPRYREAGRQAESRRKEEQRKNEQHRKRMVDVRERWGRSPLSRCPVTITLIVISLLVGLGTRLGSQREPLIDWLSIAPYVERGGWIVWDGLAAIQQGQIWRLVTPIFLHFGPLHLLFNMFMMFQLGAFVELVRGHFRMALFVLVIAIPSNVAEYYLSTSLFLKDPDFAGIIAFDRSPLFGGMSGVIYGLFGYIWMKSRFEPGSGFFIHPNTVFILMFWFVLGFVLRDLNIANMAHAGGLVTGMLLGYAPTFWRRTRNRARRRR